MIWLLLTLRIVSNPLSNVFQKILAGKGAAPLFIIAGTHGMLSIICAPLLLDYWPQNSSEFWFNISVCSLLAIIGNSLLVRALSLSDLSILGPINAWKSVISLIPGVILLQEVPSGASLTGIALIVAGSYFLAGGAPSRQNGNVAGHLLSDRGIRYRVAALVLSAVEAVFLKQALRASSPTATFAVWSVAGFILAVPAVLWPGHVVVKRELEILKTNWEPLLGVGLTTGLMQFSTLLIFDYLPVAGALALFQMSTLLSVLLGRQVFRERETLKRLAASIIMSAGAALIVATS